MPQYSGGTAPFNRPAAYILFSGFYSVIYLLDYLVVVPLTYATFASLWPRSSPWQWALFGGVLFAASVPLWEAAFGHDVPSDTIFGCVLGTIAGATALYVLRHSNPSFRVKV